MGRKGLYFRKSLNKTTESKSKGYQQQGNNTDTDQNHSFEQMLEIESLSVDKMIDSSSKELLEEINRKQKKIRIFPISIIVGIIAFFIILGTSLSIWSKVILYIFLIGGIGFSYYWDVMKKSVVILFDMEEPANSLYKKLHDSFKELLQCKGTWHIEASVRNRDKKYHGGADECVRRKETKLSIDSLPFIKTNVEVPQVSVGKQQLAFMPDRLLIIEGKKVGAVAYDDLHLEISSHQFIEVEKTPNDAQIVGQTWKFVNKKGGPDRRFKNNPPRQIALYEHINFTSSSGLNEEICLSRTGFGPEFERAISNLSSYLLGTKE
jgi:hypothetical protein